MKRILAQTMKQCGLVLVLTVIFRNIQGPIGSGCRNGGGVSGSTVGAVVGLPDLKPKIKNGVRTLESSG
jgi:hypothetical protein